MKLIETLTYDKIVDLIFEAQNKLFLSLPSIDEEIAAALLKRNKFVQIKIVIDNSEDVIRNGFGEEKGIEKLREQNCHISQSEGNLISFIISDDIGYFLFPQSKIFSENPKGANSFKIDPVTIQLLIQTYFPTEQPTGELEFSQAASIGDSIKHFETAIQKVKENGLDISVVPFDNEKFNDIKIKLRTNPPLSPNLQRQINTYTAKIQFVELKFNGGNLKNTIAQLPKKAIPINSDDLKNLLHTRIKMFQNIHEHSDYKKFQDFKDKIEKLRKDFLIPITCRPSKSIIKMERKESFISELYKLKEESKTMTKILTTTLEEGKLNTIDLLRKELVTFFKTNEPQELKVIGKADIKERKQTEIINKIVLSVKFPEVSKLIEDISVKELFYDLTWNDFKDEILHKEFLEKKVMMKDEIKTIVDMKKAFDVKQ